MIITKHFLDTLTEAAKASPRLRMNFDLRNSVHDQSQRMLNAIEPGSIVPIHRHRNSSESVVILWGRLAIDLYDESGKTPQETIELSIIGPNIALDIPAGQWHTVHSLETGTVIMEVKDGPYQPIDPEDVISS